MGVENTNKFMPTTEELSANMNFEKEFYFLAESLTSEKSFYSMSIGEQENVLNSLLNKFFEHIPKSAYNKDRVKSSSTSGSSDPNAPVTISNTHAWNEVKGAGGHTFIMDATNVDEVLSKPDNYQPSTGGVHNMLP